VGIRLAEGDDFPYFETHGFPEDFVELERSLCPRYSHPGAPPVLDCMCGNVLQGRTDPRLPFFTERGSFCSNGTTALLRSTTEKERQSNTRNRCNGWGYETVALVPLRQAGQTFGLIQVNDPAEGRMPGELLDFVERLAAAIALGLSHQQRVKELAHKNAENQLMLEELQHRVRNSLQLTLSLLRLQERELDGTENPREIISVARRRVEAMAWVHEQLGTEQHPGTVEVVAYLRSLVDRLSHAFANPRILVEMTTNLATMRMNTEKAVSLGLLVTELVSNSLRHAFVEGEHGAVKVALEERSGRLSLVVKDNGRGLPARLGPGVGLRIARSVAERLNGTLELGGTSGSVCTLCFAPEQVEVASL
jgi:two-component sensor histidine kinase